MKGRKHRETGGANEPEEDLNDKPQNRSNTGEKQEGVANEAEERKRGGRAKRKGGGKVEGEKVPFHSGRKPRKSGGAAGFGPENQGTRPGKKGGGQAGSGSDSKPFTSARKGTDAPGRKLMKDEQDVASGED